MKWLARSPDLKPIENIGAVSACDVFTNNWQFASRKDFLECVLFCWEPVFNSELISILGPVYRRC